MPTGCDTYSALLTLGHAPWGLADGIEVVFAVSAESPAALEALSAGDLFALWRPNGLFRPLLARVVDPAVADKKGPMLRFENFEGRTVAYFYKFLARVDKLVEIKPHGSPPAK